MSASPTSAGADGRARGSAGLPGLPGGLFVAEWPPSGGWGSQAGPLVVLVHGSLDRSASFRRVAQRLADLGVVAYDRRGYQRSRGVPVSDDLAVHVDDLVHVATVCAEQRSPRAGVVAVGQSAGATIVLGAAVAVPSLFAAVGAYEPTMPWLGAHAPEVSSLGAHAPEVSSLGARPGGTPDRGAARGAAGEDDPGLEAERFFRRIVGDAAWGRLSDERRDALRADGPALVADLRALRRAAPFDVTALAVPAVVASGGSASFPQHVETADWLAAHVRGVRRSTIADAGHGAHLSHPDAFASFVRAVVALGTGTSGPG